MRGRKPNPKFMTDEQIEAEVARLNASEAVKLAQKEQRLKYARKQYMYSLQCMERRGMYLMSQGVNPDNLAEYLLTNFASDNVVTEDEEDERT